MKFMPIEGVVATVLLARMAEVYVSIATTSISKSEYPIPLLIPLDQLGAATQPGEALE